MKSLIEKIRSRTLEVLFVPLVVGVICLDQVKDESTLISKLFFKMLGFIGIVLGIPALIAIIVFDADGSPKREFSLEESEVMPKLDGETDHAYVQRVIASIDPYSR